MTQTEAAAQRACDAFMAGLWELVNLTLSIGALPVVCECYGYFTHESVKEMNMLEAVAMQYPFLKDTNRRLEALGFPILPMLAALDDGTGRLKEGFFYDEFHPNVAGHHEQFRGFVPCIASIFPPELIQAKRRALTKGRASIG